MSNKGGCQQEVQLLFYVQTELNYLFTNTIIKQFVLSTSLSAFVVFVALIFNLSNQMRCYLTVSFICCLSITVIEHHDPNFLKNRVFISAYSSMIQSVTEGSQELQAVTWKKKLSRVYGRVFLTSLFLMDCSAGFLIHSNTTNPRVALYTVSWVPPH